MRISILPEVVIISGCGCHGIGALSRRQRIGKDISREAGATAIGENNRIQAVYSISVSRAAVVVGHYRNIDQGFINIKRTYSPNRRIFVTAYINVNFYVIAMVYV